MNKAFSQIAAFAILICIAVSGCVGQTADIPHDYAEGIPDRAENVLQIKTHEFYSDNEITDYLNKKAPGWEKNLREGDMKLGLNTSQVEKYTLVTGPKINGKNYVCQIYSGGIDQNQLIQRLESESVNKTTAGGVTVYAGIDETGQETYSTVIDSTFMTGSMEAITDILLAQLTPLNTNSLSKTVAALPKNDTILFAGKMPRGLGKQESSYGGIISLEPVLKAETYGFSIQKKSTTKTTAALVYSSKADAEDGESFLKSTLAMSLFAPEAMRPLITKTRVYRNSEVVTATAETTFKEFTDFVNAMPELGKNS